MGMVLAQKCVKNGWPADEPMVEMDESLLEYREGVDEKPGERVEWREWRLDGKIVKRGAHVKLSHFPK